MVIDENDAFQLFQGIETMPEDMRPRAASLLADYKAQQESLGAPLWPTQEKLKQDRKKRVQEVFNNPLVLDSDNGAFVEANKVKPGLGDNLRAREASILWLADRYNADEADVRKRYDFYKADQSQKWGVQSLDDSTFFGKAKSELDADTLRIEKRKQSALTGMESALSGATMASELARFQESYPDATEDEKLTFADTLFQTSVALLPHRKLIDSAAPAMRRIQQGQGTNEDRQTIEDLTWRLAQSTGRERQILTRSLLMGVKKVAEEGGKRDVSGTFAGSAVNLIESMFGAGRRGEELSRRIDPNQPLPIAGPIASVEDALKAMDDMARADIASRVPYDPNAPELPAARALSDDEKAFVMEAKERVKSLFKAERELKKIALSTDPMDDSILGTMASGAASSLALMLPLAMGPQGLLMAGGGYANLEREELLTEFPDMNPDDAGTISVLSGAAQAAMDKATLFGLGKFAPNVRKMIMGGVTKELVKKATAQGAALFAFENTVEAAQDLSTSVIQTMVSELSQTVPQVDWQKEKDEFLGTRADVAIGMIPLMLIGAGVNTAANKQQINKMLSDNDLMMRVGIIQEDRVKILELSTAGKTNEAEAALQDAMGRRSPELAAEVADRYASKLDSLRKVQDQISTLDITSPEYTVSVTRTTDGWQVRTGDGNVIQVDSVEAARRIAVDLRQVGSQQEADKLVGVIDGYYEKGRQAETVLTGEKVEASEEFGVVAIRRDASGAIISQRQLGPQVLETVRAEAEVAGIKTGTRGVFAHINGSNEVFPMRVADGAKEIVRRMNLYKSQAEGQPQVFTFLHENFESTWRLGIENGTFSDQETRTAMRALLPAFEGVTALNAEEAQFIDNLRTLANGQGNETMLRETVSEMVMRDVLGRDRQGRATGMKPGSISSAIEASVMGANTQEEVSALKSILAAIKAFTAYLKGVFGTVDAITKARDEGKLGEEYDTFINKVLGIDEVKQMEGQAIDEAKAMLGVDEEAQAVIDAGNMAFSISPIRNLNELSDQVERNFAENPAGALEVKSRVIRQFAKLADKWSNERWTPQGNKIRPISEKRTVKSLDKEQAMRQAQREVELVNEGMDKLTPDTLMAYSEGVGTLEDDPLVKKMLHDNGRLMSKATAAREGRDIKDQYDDLNWIPPQWYSNGRTIKTVVITRKDGSSESFPSAKVPAEIKAAIKSGEVKVKINKVTIPAVGGIMPDVMANNLGFDTASEMWAALESSIKSHRNAKADYAKAEAAVKAVEKAAFEQARQEAQAWRDEADAMQKEDWSPRESLVRDLITLEAIVAMFPQEIRGKIGGFVTLARKASEAARLKVLQRQLERGQELLEKHLKEQYGTAVDKLLERYQSKRDSSGRISGKILSTATEQVDYAAEFIDLDIASQAKEQAALEKQVEESESAEEVQDALTKLGIARLFEVWSTKDSASRESAFLWLNETIEQGKQGKKLLDEERKAFLDDMRQSGKSSILQGDELNPAIADNLTNLNKGVMRRALLGMRGVLSESLWTTLQRLELIFGEDSEIVNHFAERIINAANLSTDIKRMVEAQKKDALTVIFNSDSKFAHARGIAELQKLKDSKVMVSKVTKKEIKLDIDTLTKLADGTMSAKTAGLEQVEVEAALEEWAANARKGTVTIEKVISRAVPTSRQMSETQGIGWWLWSMQDASRKQMERDGWDADSFEQLEKFLSPEAKALGRWIAKMYNFDAPALVDPVYRRIFNAPLPRHNNYSPIYRRNMNAGGEVMDLDSSDMNSGLAAGFTKSRVNTTASLVEMDALAAFLAHWENVSHWVAHAELMRDMKAILLDKDTAVAIRQKKSEGYLQRLKQDISTIEKNGTNSANELVNMSRFWRWLMQYRAYKGLAFRISPIIKQTPALLNPLLADVPAHNYMMGMSRAFIEPQAFASEVSAMWKSDIIRRRIESGFSAESRVAMQGSSMTGSQAILAMQAGMMPMGMVDGGWTALGAAISFDYYRRGYMRENPQMTPEIADAKAIARVEKMIATSAQPSDVYARALYERSGNPFMRSMSMFVSDQRKALAVELMAIRKLATGKSKNKSLDVQRALVAHVAQAAVSQVMAGVIASLLGDDEDRDREWSTDQWTLALTLGPVNGLFVLGRLIDKVGRSLLGLRVFPSDDLASKTANDLLRGSKNMDELFSSDNSEEFIDALDSLSTAAAAGASAVIGPAAGAVDVSANVLREARKIQDRLSE